MVGQPSSKHCGSTGRGSSAPQTKATWAFFSFTRIALSFVLGKNEPEKLVIKWSKFKSLAVIIYNACSKSYSRYRDSCYSCYSEFFKFIWPLNL